MNAAIMETTIVQPQPDIKVAVRCEYCKRLMFYKLSKATGVIECKCSKCGRVTKVDLSLRMNRPGVKYRIERKRI